MDKSEFDRFADEYDTLHRRNIVISGERPDFFARYKVMDMAGIWRQHCPDRDVRQVLDFGGGIGASAPHLSELFPKATITLADVSPRSLEIASARQVPRVETVLFDGARLPMEDGRCDIVIAACVFHHIPASEHVALMGEIRRVLRRGGLFFIFEHNPWNPLTRRAVDTCPFDENAVLIPGPECCRRMASAGFGKVTLAWRIFVPGAARALRPLERWLEWLPLGAQYRAVGVR
ncbi:MAG: class I SAM-dependent methyltransferase [Pseudomonadota bacterium]